MAVRTRFHLWLFAALIVLLGAAVVMHRRREETPVSNASKPLQGSPVPAPELVELKPAPSVVPVHPTEPRSPADPPLLVPTTKELVSVRSIKVRIRTLEEDGRPMPLTKMDVFFTSDGWSTIGHSECESDEGGNLEQSIRPFARMAVTAHPLGYHRALYLATLGDGGALDPMASKDHVLVLRKVAIHSTASRGETSAVDLAAVKRA